MKWKLIPLFIIILSCCQAQEAPFTIPELTNYDSTSSSLDVIHFLQAIEKQHSNVFLDTIFITNEGRPGICIRFFNQQQARDTNRLVVYIQGNIHGGEVEGKEALLMLSRDLTSGTLNYLKNRLNILFLPNYNPDGNDQFDVTHRPSQEHCPHAVGQRRSGQDLDLNRDGVKLEGAETKGLLKNVVLKYKPMVFVDMHTTNGTWHANQLTFAPSYHTAGSGILSNFTKNTMLPAIQQIMKDSHDIQTHFYGNFYLSEGWPLKNYYTYNHHPRYLVNQFDMRNAIGILSETFAHDKFYTRIRSAYHFAREIILFCYKNHQQIIALHLQSKNAPITLLKKEKKPSRGVQFKMKARKNPIQLRTYDYIPKLKQDSTVTYVRSPLIVRHDSIRIFDRFEALQSSSFPSMYIFPSSLTYIEQILSSHGIIVDTLDEDKKLTVDAFEISDFSLSGRPFEKHNMVSIDGQFKVKNISFKKGDYIVKTDQELGFLLFYLLEPQSDDGLVKWNFFDTYFYNKGIERKKITYPVFKFSHNSFK